MSSQTNQSAAPRDTERLERIRSALHEAALDAVICALPSSVLLCSGYWPVVGASIAIVTREGQSVVLCSQDEEQLARRGWADEVRTFTPVSLNELRSVAESIHEPLRQLTRDLKLRCAQVGYEHGPASEPASYAAMHLFGGSMVDLLHDAVPNAPLAPADGVLARLASVKTPREVGRIRTACEIAAEAFSAGARQLQTGLKETEAAALFRDALSTVVVAQSDIARADGFTFCMSGPNSAEASAAYARSRWRPIQSGEFVLVHCNSYADGYWTDITRTYVLGNAADKLQRLYDAVFEAQQAALAAIRPGVRAGDVDRAARNTLARHGFEKEFKHATGHGVGFATIAHNALPRIHPKSEEVLETGMVFNVEPAVYIEGFGGLRHCDMVAVTSTGVELLTPFHASLDDLVLNRELLAA